MSSVNHVSLTHIISCLVVSYLYMYIKKIIIFKVQEFTSKVIFYTTGNVVQTASFIEKRLLNYEQNLQLCYL